MTTEVAPSIVNKVRLLTRTCPACNSDRAMPEMASTPPAEAVDFDAVKGCWHEFFTDKVFYTYCRCQDCGLLYAPTYLPTDAIAELYGDMPENMSGVPHAMLEKTQRGYFDFFLKHAPKSGNYLEVGPDTGLFTQHVARECRFDDHLLFEPNRAVLNELIQCMGNRNHQVHNEFLNFDAVPDATVSAVTMLHVLDHLLDPLETLRRLRQTMVPGGLIMVVTHDESSLLARVLGARWPAYGLQHPQLYRPATIKNLFEAAGFRVVRSQRSVNHFPVRYLGQHLTYAVTKRGVAFPLPESWSLPLKLGNFMTAAMVTD